MTTLSWHKGIYFTLKKVKKLMKKVTKNVFRYFQKLHVHVVLDYADTVSALSLTSRICAEVVIEYMDTLSA